MPDFPVPRSILDQDFIVVAFTVRNPPEDKQNASTRLDLLLSATNNIATREGT